MTCELIKPVLADLSEKYAGRATIALVDVDASRDLASRYGVRTLPHLLLFSQGQVVGEVELPDNLDELRNDLDRQLSRLTGG